MISRTTVDRHEMRNRAPHDSVSRITDPLPSSVYPASSGSDGPVQDQEPRVLPEGNRFAISETPMSRTSTAVVWCIRWETVAEDRGYPLYGALLHETYPSYRAAQRAKRHLAAMHPTRPSPMSGGERRPVRYLVFARREDEVNGL